MTTPRLPLSALLSHLLVAFTIECDNEFEHQMPHRITTSSATAQPGTGPWLVSMAVWFNFLQYIPEEGIAIKDLQLRLGIPAKNLQALLTRMTRWWGYLRVDAASIVRFSAAGRQAATIWRPLANSIEQRWRTRFGDPAIDPLRNALATIARQLDLDLPDYLPVVSYGLFSADPRFTRPRRNPQPAHSTLPNLLSQVLLAFAIEYESDAPVSLAISANVLRLAADQPIRLRDIPRRAAVSKEGIAMALTFLKSRKLASLEPETPGSRTKLVMLTPSGLAAAEAYHHNVATIETSWQTRFGDEAIRHLRDSMERFTADPLLLAGTKPYPDNWRAALSAPEGLPHFPLVLHRGGFPDGS